MDQSNGTSIAATPTIAPEPVPLESVGESADKDEQRKRIQEEMDSINLNLVAAEAEARREGIQLDTGVLALDSRDIAKDTKARDRLNSLMQQVNELMAHKIQHDMVDSELLTSAVAAIAETFGFGKKEQEFSDVDLGTLNAPSSIAQIPALPREGMGRKPSQ